MSATVTREFTTPAIAVVLLCFALNTLARGAGETLAVFYGPLLEEFGWGRAWTSSLYSVFMLSIAVSGPLIGAIFDRYGGRVIYVGGLLVYGLGFLIASRMTELWHGWLGLGLLVGIGAAATGMTPATGIISRWFDRNMSFAISFAYSGLAAGTLLLAPVVGWMIETGGWRWAYESMGRSSRPWGGHGHAAVAPDRRGHQATRSPARLPAGPGSLHGHPVLGSFHDLLHRLLHDLFGAGAVGRLPRGSRI